MGTPGARIDRSGATPAAAEAKLAVTARIVAASKLHLPKEHSAATVAVAMISVARLGAQSFTAAARPSAGGRSRSARRRGSAAAGAAGRRASDGAESGAGNDREAGEANELCAEGCKLTSIAAPRSAAGRAPSTWAAGATAGSGEQGGGLMHCCREDTTPQTCRVDTTDEGRAARVVFGLRLCGW